jgi:sugar O-acyltransferase (sialic acid O-acetyltransferase NeuD family)
MSKIFIYGASNKTRLVIDFLINEKRIDMVQGIIDSNVKKKGNLFYGIEIIGDIENFKKNNISNGTFFCISLSELNFNARMRVHNEFEKIGYSPISIISDDADISNSASVDTGSIIFPDCRINAQARIGKCVTIYTGSLIEHDCVISDNVEISPRCVLAGGVEIGEKAFIGINATILPFVKVGKNSVIGAGAVVTKDIDDNVIVVGNPARILKYRE